MDFERGRAVYTVGDANAQRPEILESIAIHAHAQGKMSTEALKDYRENAIQTLGLGVCMALVAIWARDFLLRQPRLANQAAPPNQILKSAGPSLAKDMQSEHMSRVRKRIHQANERPEKNALRGPENAHKLENKVLGAYTSLEQKPLIKRQLIKNPEEASMVVKAIIFALKENVPAKLSLDFIGPGAHDIGLVAQEQCFYVFDPNIGLQEYSNRADFMADVSDALHGYGSTHQAVQALSMNSIELVPIPDRELRFQYQKA